MKKILPLLLIALFCISAMAQKGDRKERIKALKIAYLTEELELTKEEAQKFWPVYNAFEEQKHKMRRNERKRKNLEEIKTLSEAEAQTLLDDLIEKEQNHLQFKQDYLKDLQAILSPKKIVILHAAEDEFNRKMFAEFKKRHGALSKSNSPKH
ncbi:MAG: hypothetical protein BM564_09705 [Bacteroidetes bacterium MedPE-SWsnd-G2]|nr:MAG: hypothetical protein BM564_09705 [Bacteroidetes bacterium MedPE-SWsnd-G2]